MGQADRDLTYEQLAAVKALERALKRCAAEGVALFGMDDNILALPKAALSGDDDHDLYCEHGIAIDHGGSYVDSGGA